MTTANLLCKISVTITLTLTYFLTFKKDFASQLTITHTSWAVIIYKYILKSHFLFQAMFQMSKFICLGIIFTTMLNKYIKNRNNDFSEKRKKNNVPGDPVLIDPNKVFKSVFVPIKNCYYRTYCTKFPVLQYVLFLQENLEQKWVELQNFRASTIKQEHF
jgi:hypothetical protein